MGLNNPLDLEASQFEFSLLEVDSCMHFPIKMIILKILSQVFKTWISLRKSETAFFSQSACLRKIPPLGKKLPPHREKHVLGSVRPSFFKK